VRCLEEWVSRPTHELKIALTLENLILHVAYRCFIHIAYDVYIHITYTCRSVDLTSLALYSVWTLERHESLHNDIEINVTQHLDRAMRRVRISVDAFTYAQPQRAVVDGVVGKFFRYTHTHTHTHTHTNMYTHTHTHTHV
jgi:hypothetical protein